MIRKEPRSKWITKLIHILLWSLFFFVFLVYQPLTIGVKLPLKFWVNQDLLMALFVCSYYLNARYLVPKFLFKNNLKAFIPSVILLIVVMVAATSLLNNIFQVHQLFDKAMANKGIKPLREHNFGFEVSIAVTTVLILAISTSITSTQKVQHDLQLRLELEQDKISSELTFLKTQINPHFFFNTLNNIYALTIINVENSRVALHQLSRMMRYLLYETQQDATLLSKEVAFVKDYISLMELRLTELTDVVFETPLINKEVTMAPMLLLPFIENAFKHGISATKPSQIFIKIEQQDNMLLLQVKNSVFKDQLVMADEHSGIGLQNTIRRLDLLYPKKHTLFIDQNLDKQEYSIDLKIQLT